MIVDRELASGWAEALRPVLASQAARQLDGWLTEREAAGEVIYPPRACRLCALELTPLEDVRVVILGQDPYHGAGQAHGLCFSVAEGVKPPPSLKNIFKEMERDLGIGPPGHGNLESWARQGVLLLNNTLTVSEGKAGSHAGKGWEAITDACIAAVAARRVPTVFILWGSHAQAKAARIPALREPGPHLLLRSPHPSPLSAYRGFFGSQPFSKANEFLEMHRRGRIDWRP